MKHLLLALVIGAFAISCESPMTTSVTPTADPASALHTAVDNQMQNIGQLKAQSDAIAAGKLNPAQREAFKASLAQASKALADIEAQVEALGCSPEKDDLKSKIELGATSVAVQAAENAVVEIDERLEPHVHASLNDVQQITGEYVESKVASGHDLDDSPIIPEAPPFNTIPDAPPLNIPGPPTPPTRPVPFKDALEKRRAREKSETPKALLLDEIKAGHFKLRSVKTNEKNEALQELAPALTGLALLQDELAKRLAARRVVIEGAPAAAAEEECAPENGDWCD